MYDPIEENPHCYTNFKYVKFIDSADEESLMGCLVDLFAEYKLSGYDDKYVAKSGNSTIDGAITINQSQTTGWSAPLTMQNHQMEDGAVIACWIGSNGSEANNSIYIGYQKPGMGTIGLKGKPGIISWTASNIGLNRDTVITGNLIVNSSANIRAFEFNTTATGGNFQVMNLLAPNLTTGSVVGFTIGKARSSNQSLHLYYKEPGVGGLCMFGKEGLITFTNSSIALNQPTTITGNLTVTGKVKSNGSNTITHYAPIEAGQEISSFKVGKPVFASGSVYKRVDGKWLLSTVTDRSDCICSFLIET